MSTYKDDLTYGIVACHEPQGLTVRQRRSMFDWKGDDALVTIARYAVSFGCRVDYRIGKYGKERTRYTALPDGTLDLIREDGVPHTVCADFRPIYGLGDPACVVCGDLGCEFCPKVRQ